MSATIQEIDEWWMYIPRSSRYGWGAGAGGDVGDVPGGTAGVGGHSSAAYGGSEARVGGVEEHVDHFGGGEGKEEKEWVEEAHC